jgi:hypothetical protein
MKKKLDWEDKCIVIELMHWSISGDKLISLKNLLTRNIRHL